MTWSTYVAVGDSLTAGAGDAGRDGFRIGWAQRLADILSVRTAVRCQLTNLAVDSATVSQVLSGKLPAAAAAKPDLLSLTVGMNDIRARGFDELGFKAGLGQLLDREGTRRHREGRGHDRRGTVASRALFDSTRRSLRPRLCSPR